MARITDVTGYTFDADIYCIRCTKMFYNIGNLTSENPDQLDENGIPEDVQFVDRYDGGKYGVGAVFLGSEWDWQPSCGFCGEEIEVTLLPYPEELALLG